MRFFLPQTLNLATGVVGNTIFLNYVEFCSN